LVFTLEGLVAVVRGADLTEAVRLGVTKLETLAEMIVRSKTGNKTMVNRRAGLLLIDLNAFVFIVPPTAKKV
jgi:hypothetical protein